MSQTTEDAPAEPAGLVRIRGHHNQNYVATGGNLLTAFGDLPAGVRPKFRVPIPGSMRFDFRTWFVEEDLLRCLAGRPGWHGLVPSVLGRHRGHSVHTYVEGVCLDRVAAPGRAVAPDHLTQIVAFFGRLAAVPRRALPPLSRGWPWGNSTAFFRRLTDFTCQIFAEYADRYGSLFRRLDISVASFQRYAYEAGMLHDRPFALVHGDLHQENIIVRPNGGLFFLDWELATFGDPVYDLATHLRLMRYPDAQRDEVVERWQEAVTAVDSSLAHALRPDLDHYLGFKRLQAVHTDTVRAAAAVERGEEDLGTAVARVHRVLVEAAGPLRLRSEPAEAGVRAAFEGWLRRDRPGSGPAYCNPKAIHFPGVSSGSKPIFA
jgi:aminoglycoside phosphotransferase (APT) family kinase protein